MALKMIFKNDFKSISKKARKGIKNNTIIKFTKNTLELNNWTIFHGI